jgi:hypothetical protein
MLNLLAAAAGLTVVALLGWFLARKVESEVALVVLTGLSLNAAMLLSAAHFGGFLCFVNSGACINRSGKTIAQWLTFPLVYWTVLLIVGLASFAVSAIWSLVHRSARP